MDIDLAKARAQEARALLDLNRDGDAADILIQAIAQTPGDAELHALLSVSQERLGNIELAIASAARAAEIDMADANRLARVATLQLDAGFHAIAQATMSEVLSRHRDHAGYHHIMSIVHERQGEYDRAIVHASESIRLEPNDYNRFRRLGIIQLLAGRPSEAEATFNGLIKIKPDCAEYYDLLATALERQNRYGEAGQALRQAVKLDPMSATRDAKMQELSARQNAADRASDFVRTVDPVTLELLPLNFGHLLFSAFGEDGVLLHLLRTTKNGFYVDIGAHHPIRMSNTAWLHKFNGWSGINIDADQRYIEEFKVYRPNDINICCGVGAKAGTATMAIFSDGAINSFDPSEIEKSQTKGGREVAELRELPIRTLVNILDTPCRRLGYGDP